MGTGAFDRVVVSRIFWMLILLVVGGYFRVVAVEDTIVDTPLRADALDYYLYAHNLVHYGTYSRSRATLGDPAAHPTPDAFRWPGMPLLIAPLMSQWPDHGRIEKNIRWMNVALGLAGIAMIFLAASVVLPLPFAVIVGLLTACAPHLVSLSVYALTETPACFLVIALLAACTLDVPGARGARTALFLALGALVGVLALFRPVFLVFAPVMALACPNRSDRFHALVYGCLGAALVVAPWFIRNSVSVPPGNGPSLLAMLMLQGAYHDFVFNGDPSTFPYGAHADPKFDSLVSSVPATLQEVVHRLVADPGGSLVWYLVRKPVYLFQWSNVDGFDVFVYPIVSTPFMTDKLFIATHALYASAHGVLLLLAAIGAVAAWPAATTRALAPKQIHVVRMASLLLFFVYFAHVPFMVNARYAAPVYPAMYLLAAFAVVVALRILRRNLATKRMSAINATQPPPND